MLRRSFLCFFVALLAPAFADAQTFDTGAITGRVVDGRSGDPLLGATVAVSGGALNGALSALTDGNGEYFVTAVPPGVYTVSVYYSELNVHQPNVVVSVGVTTRVDATLAAPPRRRPSDSSSIRRDDLSLGELLTWEYFRTMPLRSRSYDGAIGAAPGAAGDDLGIGFGGAQSVENAYLIDGLDTTGVTYANGGSPVRSEFVHIVDIVTSGFDAQVGRAMGGMIRVVTKSGTNRLHGSVFGAYRPFEAERDAIVAPGAVIVGKSTLAGEADLGFDLGGPIIADRAWFYLGFAPSVTRTTVTRIVGTQVDRRINGSDSGDGDPRTSAEYGCELQPAPSGLLTQCEADGIADVDPATDLTVFEEIERTHATAHEARYAFIGKITAAPGEYGNHQAWAQILGTPATGRTIGVNGTPIASQSDFRTLSLDAVGGWTSRLMGSRLELSALAGWHRWREKVGPIDPALEDEPRIQFDRISLGMIGRNPDQPESAQVLDLCTDNDPMVHDYFPRITNCPVAGYGINSLGGVTDKREDRLVGQLAAKYRWRWSGQHTSRAGVQLEDDQLHDFSGYTGGVRYRLRSARDYWREFRYVRIDPNGPDVCGYDDSGFGVPIPRRCEFLDRLMRSTEAVRAAAFVDDSWSVIPDLIFYGGLRLEHQRLKLADELIGTLDPLTDRPLDEDPVELTGLAPRFGFSYDWTSQGRARLFGTWGRYFESIPLDMANRAFGGEAFYEDYYDARDPAICQPWADEGPDRTPQIPSDPRTCEPPPPDPFGPPLTYPNPYARPGLTSLVMPGLKPPYVDELVLGVEYQIDSRTLFGVALQHRRIGDVVEDVSTDGANNMIIANPGAALPDDARAQLEADIAALSDPRVDPRKREALENRLAMLEQVARFDRAERQTTAVQLRVHHRFRSGFSAHASYTYSRTTGNYGGLYAADNGQLDPNVTSQYDLIELLANRDGPLPQDRPHNLKLDGAYRYDLNAGRAESVTLGFRLRAISGAPVSTLGSHAYYGPNESFILPRGSAGRTDFQTGADLRVMYERAVGRTMRVSLFLDVYNVFNTQGETDVDQMYTIEEVNPIVGGDQGDLRHLKIHDGGFETPAVAQAERTYGMTNGRAAPLGARIGFRVDF